MLRIQNITKIFNKGKEDEVCALNNISLQINKGEFVVVVGANGSGKSTLMNLILGSYAPTLGQLLIDDQDITALPEYKRSKWVSMVFQNPAMGTAPDLSVHENFRLASLRTRSKKLTIGNDETFRRLVKEKITTLGLGLENKIEQPMGSLSGGQRQALTLLMGVMDKTAILLMDEPTAALDPKSSSIIMQLAEKINQDMGITIILITHSMKDALQYGNRLLYFKSGKIEHDLNADQKKQLQLSQLYEWFG
jgi:putative ABC transport system ATP-binding protein